MAKLILLTLLLVAPFIASAQDHSKPDVDSTIRHIRGRTYQMNGMQLTNAELVQCLKKFSSSAEAYRKSQENGFYQAGFYCLGFAGSIFIALNSSNISRFIIDFDASLAIAGAGLIGYGAIAEDIRFNRAIRLYNGQISKR
ncbi:MAG: hypothetical protein ACLQQ4_00395 [Bacteroidia bacterium]